MRIDRTMTDRDEAARAEILTKLALSREELRRVLDPPRRSPDAGGSSTGDQAGRFPRSRTLRMLMSGRGMGTLGAVVAGLLVARPALALRILRMLPAGAIGKMLLVRAVSALRAKQR
jgi:hypothetical protein